MKFSISPGAKRLKSSGGSVSEMCKESALPYESSDEGEEEETEAAENILQDEEKSGIVFHAFCNDHYKLSTLLTFEAL